MASSVDEPYPRSTLAHLGLRRAYALEGNTSASRDEYAKFLALWKDADPYVPMLQQTRAEFGRLARAVSLKGQNVPLTDKAAELSLMLLFLDASYVEKLEIHESGLISGVVNG